MKEVKNILEHTRYPVAGNSTLPSIVCPAKYESSSLLKSILMTDSPDPAS